MSEDQTAADSTEEVTAAAISDGAYTLLVADFNDTESAWSAYQLLQSIEDDRHVKIEGVVVVKKDAEGKLEVQKSTDHSTKHGTLWGAVGGAVLGVVFPPSILGSALVLGAGGAAVGKARGVHHKHEIAEELDASIAPGHSGIVALVSDPAVVDVREALEKANGIVEKAVDKAMADDIRAVADEVEAGS